MPSHERQQLSMCCVSADGEDHYGHDCDDDEKHVK